MRKSIDKAPRRITQFFKDMPKKTRTWLTILAVVVLASAIVVTALLSRTTYVTLFYGMTAEETGEITDALAAMNVSYRLEGSSAILVPEDQVNEIKAQLAFEGVTSSDSFNYDIFTNETGFGATDLEKQTYQQYQNQNHIRAMLNQLEKVKSSAVTISPVSDSGEAPGVLVVLELASPLDDSEAAQIADFVATAAEVDASTVVIMDTSMTTY